MYAHMTCVYFQSLTEGYLLKHLLKLKINILNYGKSRLKSTACSELFTVLQSFTLRELIPALS